MKPRWVFIIANLLCGFAWGQEASVIDVHRSIPLSDTEPTYRDYYLSGDAKLRPNLIVTVYRKKPIRDPNGMQFLSELKIPVGQLRILSVHGPLAIAREHKIFDRATNPFLDIQGIMVGDITDIKGSFAFKPPQDQIKSNDSSASQPKDIAIKTTAIETATQTPQAPQTPVEKAKVDLAPLKIEDKSVSPQTEAEKSASKSSAEAALPPDTKADEKQSTQ
ncbi:MAG TPA: hypothetical protein PLU50_11645 [Pseudobdellovibrionaceae bacterium]|nr:hypothetical protein [Pseudobdellovibrionaceae bacterium]